MRKDIQEKLKGMPELLTIGQVAEIFSIHQDTLRNWEKDGTLVPLRVGPRKDRKYRPQDIEAIVDKMGSKLTLPQLEAFLWKSADILRGKIDSSDYKKYIFGLLFYKRMSDVWDEEYASVMKEYSDEDIARADYNHRFQVPKDARWEKVTQQAENIGQKLNDIFEALANANSPKLDKIFDDLDFANKDRFPNETLQRLINHFSQYNFGNTYISSDLLGDAYEYLIKQFAADAGKKGGEFYTPREVEKVIISILKPHQKDHIYDPTVGSGGFLLEAYDYLKQKSGEKIAKTLYLYGQEQNLATFAIAKINMFLHGLDSADIRRGDTLANPQFLNQQGNLQAFDVVVANPPYAIKDYEFEVYRSNKFGRIDGYDMPPEKNADYAFVLHILKSMNANGRAGVVLPHGVLFRSGAEGRLREQIVKNDLIEAIIALPSKLFYGTGISAAIVVFNNNKPSAHKGKILMIDAEREYVEGKNQNFLRRQNIEKIVDAYEKFSSEDGFSKVISLEEVETNEFNLNVRRYIEVADNDIEVDIDSVWEEIEALEEAQEDVNKEVKNLLKTLKQKNTSSPIGKSSAKWVTVTTEDLLKDERGAIKIGPFGSQLKKSFLVDKGYKVYGQENVFNNDFTIGDRYVDEERFELLKSCELMPGDLVISMMGTIGKCTVVPKDIERGIMDSHLLRMRIDEDKYDKGFILHLLISPYVQKQIRNLAVGGIMQGLSSKIIKQLKFSVPTSLDEQKRISDALSTIDNAADTGVKTAEKIAELKAGLTMDLLGGKKRI
jgi:type I restriction enzyme M protein